MNLIDNVRIEFKFIGAFIVISVIGMVIGFIGIRNLAKVNGAADQIYQQELLGLSFAKEANIDLAHAVGAEKNAILAASEQDRQASLEGARKNVSLYQENLRKAKPLFHSEKGKELFARVEKAWEEYSTVQKQVLDLVLKEQAGEKKESAELSMGLARQKLGVLDQALAELTKVKEENAKALLEENNGVYEYTRNFMIILVIAGFLAGIGMGAALTLSVTRPIKRIINGMTEGAEQVSAASSQVSSASAELAEGASEQASSIEETSSSLEEMSSMTKQNADNAGQANRLMAGTRDTVSRASRTMDRLTSSMSEISRASEETSKIIKTIDEIAFQTNLLALNAAVEAARAGEAGAGFAVVADEVRNLAMRAAEAAKNTASLIEGTVKKVKEGSELVEITEREFREVAESVGKSGELIGEISAASQEQAQGIEQVNKAVTAMDMVVQKNAANAEESASASEEMNAQAQQMKEFVRALAALVGGANSAALSTDGAKIVTARALRAHRPATTALPPGNTADGASGKKASAQKSRSNPSPEQVIPFDESDSALF